MGIVYGLKWPFYSCCGSYWIVEIYVVSIMQGSKRSFLLGIVVYETLYGHCVYWDRLYRGYVSRVELPIQRRLCPIFVRNVGSPDIHERFRRLTGSQRTPEFWDVTNMLNKLIYTIY